MGQDDVKKFDIYAHNGAQVIIADGSAMVNAVQNNGNKRNDNSGESSMKFQNNKKQDYIDNWNSRLFLHMDNGKKPLTLADAFIMPNIDVYYYHSNINESEHEGFEQILGCFLNDERTSVLLIVGVPGIGKTSITSWFANKYKEDDRVIVLRFRDWDYDDFGKGLLNAIYDILCCNRKDLSDKILVLDGFDEIKCLDRRKQILNEFNNDINDLERSKIIITSRSSYIDQVHFNNNIVLRPFNIEKIKEFYKNITGKVLNERDIDTNNLDVLGVPVILYMAIMSDIDITKTATKPELYNRIFAERGGIFDKFCEYDSGSQIMRNSDNIVCYLDFLRTVAFKMFEKNELVLSRNEYEIPKLSFKGKAVSVLEFPIKHLFENTSANIEFIHKSIYEYFVSEYIYKLMDNILLKEEKSLETDLAGVLGDLFSKRRLSDEILEFLKYKIRNGNFSDKFYIVNDTFQLMLKDGMTYYTKKCYKNVIQCETDVFANMLEVIHLLDCNSCRLDLSNSIYLTFSKSEVNLCKLNLTNLELQKGNLSGADLSKVNLHGSQLQHSNLSKANLKEADLSYAKLEGANLRETNLTETNCTRADLTGADLRGAKLVNTIFKNACLKDVDFRETDLVKVNLADVNLSTTYLRGAILLGVNLARAYLARVDLSGTYLYNADLSNANLTEVNLENANLENAQLKGVILRDAYLKRANLAETDLSNANLTGAYLKRANLKEAVLIGVDLRRVDLAEVNLYAAVFDEDQIEYLKGKIDLQYVKVFLNKSRKVINYEEYCNYN